MLCPRCHIPLLKDYCPRCGFKATADLGSRTAKVDEPSRKKILDFESETELATGSQQIDWLKEWEDRQRSPGSDTVEKRSPQPEAAEKPAQTDFEEKKDSRSKRDVTPAEREGEPGDERKRTAPRRSRQATFEKPRIRMPPRSNLKTSPRQPALQLEPLPVPRGPEPREADSTHQRTFEEIVSREILFSRFLSGIIDLCLPILVGFAFVFAASWILGFDFFMADSLEWAALISVFVFFLTSLFFFTTSQQTPGMYLTQLRLIRDGIDPEVDREDIGFSAVFIRVLFFLPVVLSGIGLLWSIFDPLRRCGHDFLSGTRVIPEDSPQVSS